MRAEGEKILRSRSLELQNASLLEGRINRVFSNALYLGRGNTYPHQNLLKLGSSVH